MSTEDNIHVNHRQRMREKFLASGIDGFNDVELLEFLLFYAQKRSNTNPTAHKLLKEFGSLGAVINANVFDLMTVDGVGEQSATLLSFVGLLLSRARVCEQERYSLSTPSKMLPYCHSLIKPHEASEIIGLLCLDAAHNVIHFDIVAKGSLSKVGIDIKTIVRYAMRHNAPCVILLHNHLSKNPLPSKADIEATQKLIDALSLLGIDIIDHIIVAGNKCYSIARKIVYDASNNQSTAKE